MRRITLTIAIFFSAYMSAYPELPVDFFIQSEFKKDTIDYSETEKTYFRERFSVLFSEESVFNISYIRVEQEKENRYTWYLLLNDISPHVSILLGNYFTHFGTGLLVGRKRLYEPDIFAIRSNINTDRSFTPCKTGIPVFVFNGIANTLSCSIGDVRLSLNLFYSIKERFESEDYYASGKIPNTFDTIDNKTDYNYNQNEPLNIHTGGAMLSIDIMNNVLFQAYYLNAGIRSQYKDDFVWEYNYGYNESSSIAYLNGFGLFAEYRDDFLRIFSDAVMTQKEVITNENKSEKVNGYGIIYGIRFNPPFLLLGITGKEVGSSFYSPYSSSIGEDYPESAWFFDTEIKPYSNLKLIAQISSEKKTAPSTSDNDLPVIKKKNIALVYYYDFIEKLYAGLRRRERFEEDNKTRQEYNTGTDIRLTDRVKIKFATSYLQSENTGLSSLYHAGIILLPWKFINIQLHYLAGFISENNRFYATPAPMEDSATKGFFITQTSHTVVLKSDLRLNAIYLSCRYIHQFNNERTLSRNFEIYAYGYF